MAEIPAPLPPGSVIGILGGGQLGRMLAAAANELGFRCHIYCPDPGSPAFDCARFTTVAAYDDTDALSRFAHAVDIVTYEFENVPASTADTLSAYVPVRPGREALAISQDRLEEKRFAASVDAATAPFWPIDSQSDLAAVPFDGSAYVLKTRRLGYDGKGQAIVRTCDDAAGALAASGNQPSIIEAFIDFEREISVILARGRDGQIVAYEPGENTHRSHILDQTRIPANLTTEVAAAAVAIAGRFAHKLDYVGILAVEFFVSGASGQAHLLVNEIAPRVHNSGHWTQDGARTSQFEQHIRAIAGWPLAPAATLAPTVMTNLVGHQADNWAASAGDPEVHIHIYGKAETRPGRKMGHLNRVKSPA